MGLPNAYYYSYILKLLYIILLSIFTTFIIKGVVNCQNSRDKGPPEGNGARG